MGASPAILQSPQMAARMTLDIRRACPWAASRRTCCPLRVSHPFTVPSALLLNSVAGAEGRAKESALTWPVERSTLNFSHSVTGRHGTLPA